jgi:hypothetical protein
VKAGVRLGLVCAVLILPVHAFGQESTWKKDWSRDRTWDVAGTIEVRPHAEETLPFSLHVDLGHYWTTHVKTELSVVTARERAFELDTAMLPDGRSTSVRGAVGPFGISTAATYEFFDHASTRSYGSIGLDVSRLSQFREIYSAWHRWLATDRQQASVLVRPFLAVGFKSYVGRSRAFLRSETIIAAGPHALRNVVFRAGAGIDF